jgi:WG containing repeat
MAMIARIRSSVAALVAVLLVRAAVAQDQLPELTPAGQAILKGVLAFDSHQQPGRAGPTQPKSFPLAMCAFHGGLFGAVNRDGTVAVPPRYDWVGTFSDGRAAIRVSGLYVG